MFSKVFLRNTSGVNSRQSRNDFVPFHAVTGARGMEAENMLQKFTTTVGELIIDNYHPQIQVNPRKKKIKT